MMTRDGRGLPQVVRVLAAGLIFGVATWLVLDHYQSHKIGQVVEAEFTQRLQQQAREDRLRFDASVRSHFTLAKLLAEQSSVRRHVARRIIAGPAAPPDIIDGLPGWLPERAGLRLFPTLNLVALYDADDRPRELYRLGDDPVPNELVTPDFRLLSLSEKQAAIVPLGKRAYLLSSSRIAGEAGKPAARLLLATELSTDVLLHSQGLFLDTAHIIALVDRHSLRVLASSRPLLLPPGIRFGEVAADYLMTGNAFLDYGTSEVEVGFVTLIPRSALSELSQPILAIEREGRTVLGLAMGAVFVAIALYATARLRRLIGRVVKFMDEAFGVIPPSLRTGDELTAVEREFENLTREVVASHRELKERTQALEDEVARHVRTEKALVAAKEHAEYSNRAKSEFLANMSHELRTPLNAIIGFSEVMTHEILGPIGHDTYRGYIGDINSSGQHLLDVINDILDVSKIEAGRMELILEDCDPAEIVCSALRLIGPRATAAGLNVSADIPTGLATVSADKRRLKQAVLNLIANAVKFTLSGGGIEVSLRAGQEIEIEIADSGIGMSPDDLAVALKPFGQVDGSTARRFEGTGLGLPLARAFIEMHGGHMRIASVKDRGTTVTVALPLAASPPRGPRDEDIEAILPASGR